MPETQRSKKQKKASCAMKVFTWEVPEERLYDDETHKIEPADNHALKPFVELNTASKQERDFIQFLEENSEWIDWWYKNGDKGRQHYAVEYTWEDGSKHPLYVDFVIRLKNGKIFLFDTKNPDSEPHTACLKHNALVDYIAEENVKGANLAGGVIVKDGLNWVWSHSHIKNTRDHAGWTTFCPKSETCFDSAIIRQKV